VVFLFRNSTYFWNINFKIIVMKYTKYLFLIIIASLLFSCNTSSISIQALRPAEIALPQHIKTIVVMNRTRPTKNGQVINILEGILTGEGIGVDRAGAENAMSGLLATLSASPRFNVMKANIERKGSGTGWFPDPLPTSDVRGICEQFKADALITLEAFDSNTFRTFADRKRKVKKDNVEVEETVRVVNERVQVTAGWRLYDAKNVSLLDQFRMNTEMTFSKEATTEALAISLLPTMNNMITQVGGRAGNDYAFRIAPQYVWLSRMYYTGKHRSLKNAKLRVRANDWEGAAEIWRPMTSFQIDRKAAGRACYNMAVANEVMGRLEDALTWARKASYDYNNKKARAYINEINRRIQDQRRLDSQMGNTNN
jgi:hypothetical protein